MTTDGALLTVFVVVLLGFVYMYRQHQPICELVPLICSWEGTLMVRIGVQPFLPMKVSITIGTMLNFYDEFDGHGDGNVTCKQTLVKLRWEL